VNEFGVCVAMWTIKRSAYLYEWRLELPYRTTAVAAGAGGARAFAVLQSRGTPFKARLGPTADGTSPLPNVEVQPARHAEPQTDDEKAELRFLAHILQFWADTVWSL
jgi:hypothetical protein